jgi:hypothetical protein
VESGKWKMGNGKCLPAPAGKMENGKWKLESGERRIKKLIASIHNCVKMPLPLEVVLKLIFVILSEAKNPSFRVLKRIFMSPQSFFAEHTMQIIRLLLRRTLRRNEV